MESIIKACMCESEYMDKMYGKSNRVMNPKQPKGRLAGYRCTVCGNEIV